MRITYPKERFRTNFVSKNSLAIGGTVKVSRSLPGFPNLKYFGEFGGMRFTPIGHSRSTSTVIPGDFYMKFDWREYWGTAGTIFSYEKYDIYAGLQGIKIQQKEIFSGEEYISGLQLGVLAGLDLHFATEFVLNLQVRSFNGGAVSVGISQSISYKE